MSINGSTDGEQEEHEEDILNIASHDHGDGNGEEKLSNKMFQQR